MPRQESFQGSLPLLVLKILARLGPIHGYGITVRIQETSEDMLRVEEARWTTTGNKRRARIYEITAEGRRWLEGEEKRWMTVNAAVMRALKHA